VAKKNGIKIARKPRDNSNAYHAKNPNTQAMCDAYEAGSTLQQIGDTYGVSRERVRQILRAEGVASKGWRLGHGHKPHPLTTEQIEAAAMNAMGAVLSEILTAYPTLTQSKIVIACNRLNGVYRKNGQNGQRDAAAISADYAGGVAIRDICVKYGIKDAPTIYHYLKRTGTPTRRLQK
jgi:Sigma-70, region 4